MTIFQDELQSMREALSAASSHWIVLMSRMLRSGMKAKAEEYMKSFQALVAQQQAMNKAMQADMEACEADNFIRIPYSILSPYCFCR